MIESEQQKFIRYYLTLALFRSQVDAYADQCGYQGGFYGVPEEGKPAFIEQFWAASPRMRTWE
jgi:hypothetical protein